MKNLNEEKLLHKVFDELNLQPIQRTAVLYEVNLGHFTVNDLSEITTDKVKGIINHITLKG
jgi:hypothetical protein